MYVLLVHLDINVNDIRGIEFVITVECTFTRYSLSSLLLTARRKIVHDSNFTYVQSLFVTYADILTKMLKVT